MCGLWTIKSMMTIFIFIFSATTVSTCSVRGIFPIRQPHFFRSIFQSLAPMATRPRPKPPPSFFKVLIQDNFAHRLRLPTAFLCKYGYMVPDAVTLRLPFWKTWVVNLERDDAENCYFSGGWADFAEDSELQVGEFLVFRLDENSVFDVKVYGTSGCERQLSKSNYKFLRSDPRVLEVELSSEDHKPFINSVPRGVRAKRSKASSTSGKKAAKRSKKAPPSVNPLCFEMVLKGYHRSRLTMPKKFAENTGIIHRKKIVLEYVPRQRFTSVALVLKNKPFVRLDMSWYEFRKDNKLEVGRTYSFEFNPSKDVIEINEIKNPE